MTEEQKRHCLAVADAIEQSPRRYNQGTFGAGPPCATTHCVAGWSGILDHDEYVERDLGHVEWVFRRRDALGIRSAGMFGPEWPSQWMQGTRFEKDRCWSGASAFFLPTAEEAVDLLRRHASGEFTELSATPDNA